MSTALVLVVITLLVVIANLCDMLHEARGHLLRVLSEEPKWCPTIIVRSPKTQVPMYQFLAERDGSYYTAVDPIAPLSS